IAPACAAPKTSTAAPAVLKNGFILPPPALQKRNRRKELAEILRAGKRTLDVISHYGYDLETAPSRSRLRSEPRVSKRLRPRRPGGVFDGSPDASAAANLRGSRDLPVFLFRFRRHQHPQRI